jgi:hypothetical protein
MRTGKQGPGGALIPLTALNCFPQRDMWKDNCNEKFVYALGLLPKTGTVNDFQVSSRVGGVVEGRGVSVNCRPRAPWWILFLSPGLHKGKKKDLPAGRSQDPLLLWESIKPGSDGRRVCEGLKNPHLGALCGRVTREKCGGRVGQAQASLVLWELRAFGGSQWEPGVRSAWTQATV